MLGDYASKYYSVVADEMMTMEEEDKDDEVTAVPPKRKKDVAGVFPPLLPFKCISAKTKTNTVLIQSRQSGRLSV